MDVYDRLVPEDLMAVPCPIPTFESDMSNS